MQLDFGNLLSVNSSLASSGGNHTRGIVAGGDPDSGLTNVIQFVTISTTGNATDFGDLTQARSISAMGQVSSATRSVFAGGITPSASDVIDYVTTATTGNATDFGNLSVSTGYLAACSSTTSRSFCRREQSSG